MAEPPVLAGALQERSIAVVPLAVAERPVGAPGTVVVRTVMVELLMTAGTPCRPVVKVGVSLPRTSWRATASSPAVGSV